MPLCESKCAIQWKKNIFCRLMIIKTTRNKIYLLTHVKFSFEIKLISHDMIKAFKYPNRKAITSGLNCFKVYTGTILKISTINNCHYSGAILSDYFNIIKPSSKQNFKKIRFKYKTFI